MVAKEFTNLARMVRRLLKNRLHFRCLRAVSGLRFLLTKVILAVI